MRFNITLHKRRETIEQDERNEIEKKHNIFLTDLLLSVCLRL